MRVRVNGNTKASLYAFDFRTRQDDNTIRQGNASIWLASIVGDDFEGFYYNIGDFINAILDLSKKENCCFYCFDLGFHWSYIFYGLMKKGFQYTKRMRADGSKKFTAFGTTHATVVYSATIKGEGAKSGFSFFKDLKQVYAGFKNLEEMAGAFRSSRKFYPDDLEKEHGEGEEPTKEEKDNCRSRAGFLFDVLKRQESDPEFFRAFTLASYTVKAAIKHAFGWCKNPYAAYRSSKMYPKIEDKEQNEALRASIAGGLTGPTIKAIDEQYLINQELFIIDRTQSYPSEMKYSKLPRGVGQYFEGRKMGDNMLHLYHIRIISFDGVKIHSLPALMQTHMHFMPEGSEPIDLWVWEWEYWQAFDCYINIKMEVLEGYAYKKGVCPFGSYVENNQEERRKMEAEGDYIRAAHMKALNVSLYGKLIQRPSKEKIIMEENEETGILDTKTEFREEEKEANYIYLPAGSCIPSLARYHLILLAKKFGYENVVYVETDCLIVIANEKTKAVLDGMELSKELGHWHLEALATKAYFPMAKRYKYEKTNGETVVKGAGLDSKSFSKIFEDVRLVGSTVTMRQKKRVKGGTLLVKIKKKLKEAI